MTHLSIEWRVSPEHVALLPAAVQTPNIPITIGLPERGDLVQLAERDFWVISARQWERHGQGWKLVLQIAPDQDKQDIGSHTLH